MAEKNEKLFDQFPPVTTEEWRAKVDADLKGVPFEKKLVWRTNEGFNVQPMYRAEDIENFTTTSSLPGQYPYIRGTRTNNDWLTRQEITSNDPAEANKQAIEAISKGVNSVGFTVAEPTAETVKTLIEGIDLEAIEINFKSCACKALELTKALVGVLKENGKCEVFKGSIDYNPFRPALRHGKTVDAASMAQTSKEIIEAAKEVPALRVLAVDSDMLNNAGAYIFQELGYALAWGAQYLTLLTEAGLSVDEVASRIKFNMGISSNYFMEIAKFRAARMLWAE
ncbi:MAG: acyl-CoA mutase large subunit family protein, partial [Muribaculaceae bacterium]|nr:acyl-CoA mutase large subunit family protein [Muribaculaceae bacterium]